MTTNVQIELQPRGAGRASPSRSGSPPAAPSPDLTHAQRPKTALIVEGGAMRGAWAAGALRALREIEQKQFDLVVAASSGASTAAYFVADAMERAVSIWTNWVSSGRVVSWGNWLRLRPMADLSFLVDHCFRKQVPLPVAAFDHNPTRLEIVLTDCRTGRPENFQPDSRTALPALKA